MTDKDKNRKDGEGDRERQEQSPGGTAPPEKNAAADTAGDAPPPGQKKEPERTGQPQEKTPPTSAGGGTPKERSGQPGGDGGGTPVSGRDGASPARQARILAVVALIVAVLVAAAAGGAGWWGWQRLVALRQSETSMVDQQALKQRTDTLEQRIGQLDARLSNLNDQVGGRGDALADLRQRIESLKDRAGALDKRMSSIAQMARTSKDDWKRSEASYLATVAVHRLRYYHDVDAALGALKEADSLLSDFGGESIKARKGIARAIDRLIAVNPPHTDEILNTLSSLRESADALPVSNAPQDLNAGDSDGKPLQAQGSDWRERLVNAWRQFRDSLAKLVVVSREKPVMPLRTPEERFFLRQNIKLQLEAARYAALRGDQSAYEHSIGQLRDWLSSYFDPGEKPVAAMQKQLEKLAGAKVSVQLPEIASLLEPARQFE